MVTKQIEVQKNSSSVNGLLGSHFANGVISLCKVNRKSGNILMGHHYCRLFSSRIFSRQSYYYLMRHLLYKVILFLSVVTCSVALASCGSVNKVEKLDEPRASEMPNIENKIVPISGIKEKKPVHETKTPEAGFNSKAKASETNKAVLPSSTQTYIEDGAKKSGQKNAGIAEEEKKKNVEVQQISKPEDKADFISSAEMNVNEKKTGAIGGEVNNNHQETEGESKDEPPTGENYPSDVTPESVKSDTNRSSPNVKNTDSALSAPMTKGAQNDKKPGGSATEGKTNSETLIEESIKEETTDGGMGNVQESANLSAKDKEISGAVSESKKRGQDQDPQLKQSDVNNAERNALNQKSEAGTGATGHSAADRNRKVKKGAVELFW